MQQVSQDYGYFAGGYPNNARSFVDRLDYSSDTTTATEKGPLTIARRSSAATGTQSYGYFGGGTAGPAPNTNYSTVDRVEYANDTPTTVAKGPLSAAKAGLAASGNGSYGYWGGGVQWPGTTPRFSTVDRLDYSSDTTTASPKGPLTDEKYSFAATGNTSYGYFGGGDYPAKSTVNRIDYSSDTGTTQQKVH